MNKRFPHKVQTLLRAAGWVPGRAVALQSDLPNGFVLFPRAKEVLEEFGGMHIGRVGPGKECATSDVEINPALAAGLSLCSASRTDAGALLYPIGEFHHGHAILLIDDTGRVHMYFDHLEPFADSFDQALCKLLLGRKP